MSKSKKDPYENHVTVEFEGTHNKTGEPVSIATGQVPWRIAQEILPYFDVSGRAFMRDKEEHFKNLHHQREKAETTDEVKDYIGHFEKRLGLNERDDITLGRAGLLSLRLKRVYSNIRDNQHLQTIEPLFDKDAIFFPEDTTSKVHKIGDTDVESADSSDAITVKETWNTHNGKWRPNAKRIFVAFETATGTVLAKGDVPEDFSGQARESVEREAQRNLARKLAA